MGTLEGSKADVLQPQFGSTIQLLNNFDIVSDSVAFIVPNFALTLTIPAVYLVTAQVNGVINATAGAFFTSQVVFSVRQTPLDGDPFSLLPGSFGRCVALSQLNVVEQGTTTIATLFTVTKPTKIELEVARSSGATYTVSRIDGLFTALTAVQLIN